MSQNNMNCVGKATWRTKEDIIEDLSAIGQTGINDDFFVIGNRPPPPLKEFNDEYELRFDGEECYGDVSEPPDLNGIRECLRMIDQSEDEEEPDLKQNGAIVISKLNPEVREFVPGAGSSNSQCFIATNTSETRISTNIVPPYCSESGSSKPSNSSTKYATGLDLFKKSATSSPKLQSSCRSSIVSITNEVESPKQLTCRIINIEESNIHKIVSPIPKEIIEKTNELRNKISDCKVKSPNQRIQRNVAIANLLKLHAANPSPSTSKSNLSSSTEDKELKLFTPDYFIKTVKDNPTEESDENIPINVKINDNVANEAEESDETLATKSIQESIDKVNNWLEKPESPNTATTSKTPSVIMAPVSFKRKDPNTKSSVDSKVDKTESKRNPGVAQFKPSKYANDLAKKYMEASEARERQGMSIWDNLEKELKRKDEEIRKKRAMRDSNV